MLRKTLVVAVLVAVMFTMMPQKAEAVYRWGSGSYSSGSSGSSYSYRSGTYNSTYNNNTYYYGSQGSTTYQKSFRTPSYQTPTSQTLSYGSTGSKVVELQTYLKELGYNLRTENGRYGYYTLKAVQDFQRKNGLRASGSTDAETLATIKAATEKTQQPTPTPTEPKPTQPAPTTPTPKPTQPTPTTPAPSSPVQDTQGLTADEQEMLNLVNAERSKRGLSPLKVDMQLVKLARMKSQDMINNNYFSHSSPTYGSPFTMMRNNGVTYRTAGENLAGAGTVSRAHTNLINSSGHRANILNSNYTHIGIGIVDGGPYGKMFTQMFVGR